MIWQTDTQKSAQSEHLLEMDQNIYFVTLSAICGKKSIFSIFVYKVGLIASDRSDSFVMKLLIRLDVLWTNCLLYFSGRIRGATFVSKQYLHIWRYCFHQKCTCWTNMDSYGASTGPQNI